MVVRGFTISLDARTLSHDLVPLALAILLARDRTHVLTLLPAKGYAFLPSSQFVGDFRFDVTTEGTVNYDQGYDGFAGGRGSSQLVVGGFPVTLDGTGLSHDLQPFLLWGNSEILSRDSTHLLTLLPAKGYAFLPSSQLVGDFRFDVTPGGTVNYDQGYDGFASGRGSSQLVVGGFPITIDGTGLSHDLQPFLLWGNSEILSRDSTHLLTLLPAKGYAFLPSSQFVGDFRFDVTPGGMVNYDQGYDGFAGGRGSSQLVVGGFPVTIDGTGLSHDLQPFLLWGNSEILSRDRTHVLTLLPARGYAFLSAPGVVADFLFRVDVNGQVLVDSSFAGFALASNETLIISGYRIVLDGQALSYNLLPQLLGWSGGELSPGVHEFTVVPAKGYILGASQQELPDIRFSLDLAGGTTLTEAPEGVTIRSGKAFCDVPDKIVTPLQIQTFGSPKGRWR